MKHTPGPWTILEGTHDIVAERKTGLASRYICEVLESTRMKSDSPVFVDEDREWNANAHLIAAAPELLFICQELVKWEHDPDHYSGDLADLAQKAKQAITKAEGGIV